MGALATWRAEHAAAAGAVRLIAVLLPLPLGEGWGEGMPHYTSRQQSKKRHAKGLEAMAQASQRLGLYEGELDGIPRKKKR